MEDLRKLEELFDHAREYLNIRVDEVKLGVAEKESAIVAQVVANTVVNIFFLLFLLFAGVASALALGSWWQHEWLGFLAVAGIYLIAGLITWALRERMMWKERQRLRLRRDDMEKTIRHDWQGITRTLEPASLAREALTSCTTWIGKKFFSRQHSK
ncbi:MAG TPA: phage holin family protein [Puia sp.]